MNPLNWIDGIGSWIEGVVMAVEIGIALILFAIVLRVMTIL